MKHLLFFLFILLSVNSFSQEYCKQNFSFKSSSLAEMRDTVMPKHFFPLETTISRKTDTITFAFFQKGEIAEIKQFVIQRSICDTLINNEKTIVYEGQTLLPTFTTDGDSLSLTPEPTVIILNSKKKYLIWRYKDRKGALYLVLNKKKL